MTLSSSFVSLEIARSWKFIFEFISKESISIFSSDKRSSGFDHYYYFLLFYFHIFITVVWSGFTGPYIVKQREYYFHNGRFFLGNK